MSKQLAQAVEIKRAGLVVVLAVLLAALAAVGSPMWSPAAHAQSQGEGPYLCNGLYHVDANGNLIVASTTTTGQVDTDGEGAEINDTCTPAAANDINNNIISYDHMVCAVGNFGEYPRVSPPSEINSNPSSPSATAWTITTLSGNPNVVNSHVYTGSDRFDPANGENWSNGSNLYCVQWTSTQPGEQNVVIKNNHQNIVGDYADGGDPDIMSQVSGGVGVPTVVAPIKEWNVLAPTTITTGSQPAKQATDPADNDGVITNTSVTSSLIFNPATSTYSGQTNTYYENVWATHTPNQGVQQWYLANGAQVTFTNTSTGAGACGVIDIDPADNATVEGETYLEPGDSVTVTSIGASIPFYFFSDPSDYPTDSCQQTLGSTSGVSITVSYPGTVGSDKPTFPAETLDVNWQTPPAAVKQVLLAWAGQTVVLEHDWRIPAGDYSNLNSAGYCAFDDQESEGPVFIKYVRQNGPGSFVGGLDAVTLFSDGGYATVLMDTYPYQDNAAPGDPQGSCISRVLYESEDQGEVDVVAYQTLTFDGREPQAGQTGTDNQTTYPFVIYYMNMNTVNLTTVDATKPTHNSSTAPDWTPSNPWDASAETDSTTSNVSQDVLVRGRVTGWFTNSIPSGRAADGANHLPADRWVMPDDWAELAGGSLGTSFRPSYDLMFSPSNTGLALTNPQGDATSIQVAVTLDGSGTGYAGNQNPNGAIPASPILVADKGGLYVGESVYVGLQGPRNILAIVPVSGVGYGVILSSPIAKPAAGTPIYAASDGVPFEGPYSLIDIPGLAISNGGVAGAALSNIAGTQNSATRDTVLGDGQIDWWDAPMPPANISVSLRGSGFIKQVIKSDVYYLGAANSGSQTYPNPYYISNIPASPFLPANVAGGNYLWDSWGLDGPAADNGAASSDPAGLQGTGPYAFWSAVIVGGNELGIGESLTAKQQTELADIRADYEDDTIARDLTIFSDNHGEFMVAANGDFNLDYSGCATNSLGGGHECKPGDAVGTGTVTAVADYPMLKKHAPIGSNAATIDWTWGGYKSVTIEHDPAGNAQFVYVVFHALDRDGHCGNADGAVLLHSALTGIDAASATGSDTSIGNQVETVDFKIDSGDGIVLDTSGPADVLNDSASFATGVYTYSLAAAKAKVSGTPSVYFDPDPAYAADGQTDECQAWIKVSNSLLGQTNVLTIAHDDEGNIGFDRVLDFQQTQDYTLNFRWTLFTWAGADNIPVADALAGGADTKNPQGNDITDQVTAIYGWQPDSQTWLGYFPSGVDVPGANDLSVFHTGQAYWIAIKGPGNVTWTITTNVS